MIEDISQLNFNKTSDGLLPAVVQDQATLQVLMVGYMNQDALQATLASRKVTFYSRSKQRLWTKGETSGNYLELKDIFSDCDQDSLLVLAQPMGPTCHTGASTCFNSQPLAPLSHIGWVDQIIQQRIQQAQFEPSQSSYTQYLLQQGISRIAQKVGEEAVEVVIAALAETDAAYLGEMTDLIYHALVLLHAKGLSLADVAAVIQARHQAKTINP